MKNAALLILLLLPGAVFAQSALTQQQIDEYAALPFKTTHHVVLVDGTAMFASALANTTMNQTARAVVMMPDALVSLEAQHAREEYRPFKPTPYATANAMTVVVYGGAYGTSSGPACNSITRVALLSDKSGAVVAESIDQHSTGASWQNAFGATASCTALHAQFSLEDVARVQSAAPKGEFLIAAFDGHTLMKIYKVKETPYLKHLGLK